ncbi:MAG: 4Fe-4S binding protein [bacterium]
MTVTTAVTQTQVRGAGVVAPPGPSAPPVNPGASASSDTVPIDATARKKAAGRRRLMFFSPPRPPFSKRAGIQFLTLAIVIAIGFQFYQWVGALEAGRIDGTRPPGVEGFLPIAAMISLRHLIETGEFSMIHPAGLVIFSLICLTGLLLKKAFWSWLCPVGTIAEYTARFSFKVFKRRIKLPAWLDYPLMTLKYLILGFFVHAVLFRMTPAIVSHFLESPYNRVADIKMLYFFTNISPLALEIIIALALLSFVIPYFWCRYLCPYGALLGLLSTISPLKVRRSLPDCTNCGKCAAVCPSYIGVDRKRTVSSPECTGCLECVVHCPARGALALKAPGPLARTLKPAAFAVFVVMLFYGGIGVAKIAKRWESNVKQEELMRRVQNGVEGPEYGHFGR